MATLPRDVTTKLSPSFSWRWGELPPQDPLTPLPLYLPECVYNYRVPGNAECRGQRVSVGAVRAGGQHTVYFNFSESFLGDFPPPLLNSDEPLGRLGRMWFRALFSFVIFFSFFFLYLRCFALNSFGTSCPSQHWDEPTSGMVAPE